MNKIKVF